MPPPHPTRQRIPDPPLVTHDSSRISKNYPNSLLAIFQFVDLFRIILAALSLPIVTEWGTAIRSSEQTHVIQERMHWLSLLLCHPYPLLAPLITIILKIITFNATVIVVNIVISIINENNNDYFDIFAQISTPRMFKAPNTYIFLNPLFSWAARRRWQLSRNTSHQVPIYYTRVEYGQCTCRLMSC